MDTEQKIIILDAILYLITFVYWYRRKKSVNVGLFVLFIMLCSHIGAIFYYEVLSLLGVVIQINILSLLYLYLAIMLCLHPFLSNGGIKGINVGGNEKLIKYLSIFIILLSIEPFLENIYLLFHSSNVDYGEVYEEKMDEGLHIYSRIGEKLKGWSDHFRIFATVAFFYFCTREKGFTFLKAGLGMVLINYLLSGINRSSRGDLLVMSFLYLCCFLLMYPLFTKRFISNLRKISIVLAIPAFMFFIAITVSRYNSGNRNKSLVGWILLYASEGPIKFSNEMWNAEHNTNGDVNLCLLKNIIGMKTYTTYQDREEYYIAKNGRRIEVFYTFIGDFISDFGLTGGMLAALFLSILCRKLYGKRENIGFSSFMFILLFIHLYSIGFASNVYRSYYLQKSILVILLIACLLGLNKCFIRIKKKK